MIGFDYSNKKFRIQRRERGRNNISTFDPKQWGKRIWALNQLMIRKCLNFHSSNLSLLHYFFCKWLNFKIQRFFTWESSLAIMWSMTIGHIKEQSEFDDQTIWKHLVELKSHICLKPLNKAFRTHLMIKLGQCCLMTLVLVCRRCIMEIGNFMILHSSPLT